MMRFLCLLSIVGSILCTSCIPDVYLLDRQTVLELEASGEWQELDQQFKRQALNPGPQALEVTRERIEQRQIFTMTHSDSDKTTKKSK